MKARPHEISHHKTSGAREPRALPVVLQEKDNLTSTPTAPSRTIHEDVTLPLSPLNGRLMKYLQHASTVLYHTLGSISDGKGSHSVKGGEALGKRQPRIEPLEKTTPTYQQEEHRMKKFSRSKTVLR
jgi:hypothetical protein